jgi:hypothetical protein
MSQDKTVTPANVRMAQVSAVVKRRDADGKVLAVEDWGTVSYFHRNPLLMALWRLKQAIRGTLRPLTITGESTNGGSNSPNDGR